MGDSVLDVFERLGLGRKYLRFYRNVSTDEFELSNTVNDRINNGHSYRHCNSRMRTAKNLSILSNYGLLEQKDSVRGKMYRRVALIKILKSLGFLEEARNG